MARVLQVKRGLKANMPTLAQAEFGFTTDANKEQLYIGNGAKNLQLARVGNAFTITLPAASWSDNTLTISNDLFVASGYAYTITPTPTSFKAYASALIYAEDITADGSCTFVCDKVPTEDLTVNVLRNEVGA